MCVQVRGASLTPESGHEAGRRRFSRNDHLSIDSGDPYLIILGATVFTIKGSIEPQYMVPHLCIPQSTHVHDANCGITRGWVNFDDREIYIYMGSHGGCS